jgi:hypothetical protein
MKACLLLSEKGVLVINGKCSLRLLRPKEIGILQSAENSMVS